jgi:ribonuclease HI
MKLNIDGAYKDQAAGAGMVLQDSQGEVVFSACRSLQNYRDATEAELLALEEGLRLALHWTQLGFSVEIDCAEAEELLRTTTPNTSVLLLESTRTKPVRCNGINLFYDGLLF